MKLAAPSESAAVVLAVVAATVAVREVLEVRAVRVVAWALAKGAALSVVVVTREEVARGAVRGAAMAVKGRVAVWVEAMAVEVRVAAPIAQL